MTAPTEPWTCPSCFRQSEIEAVQIRQPDRSWADSSIKRCSTCKHSFGGTLSDRIAYVNDVYNYKYFGDYDLSSEQLDAVGEMISIAMLVPALLAALHTILNHHAGSLKTPAYEAAMSAIAKAEGPALQASGGEKP
jgi:hypothetical protein